MQKQRSQARELALQFLYQCDLRGREVFEQRDDFLAREEEDQTPRIYAKELINGCLAHWEEIEQKIKNAAQNWNIGRMAVVDRTILRLALYELLYREDVPARVVLNEAIELGKKYSTSNSGAFINGILDKLLKESKMPQSGKE